MRTNSSFGSALLILAAGQVFSIISARTKERERRGSNSKRTAGPLPLPTPDYARCWDRWCVCASCAALRGWRERKAIS